MGSQHHQQQHAIIFDAWMQEVGEAKQLAEEIETRIRDRDSALAAGADRSHHVLISSRRKLMVLGTQLDRLESLIHNPPAKPVLSERDLHSRKDMILDMRQQLKQLALSLSTLQSSKKTNVQDANANLQLDTEKATSPNNSGVNCFQGQNIKDKEPVCSKVTETDKKHMVISVEEESNLQSPLLDSVDKDGNGNQSSPQVGFHKPVVNTSLEGVQNGSLVASRCFDKCQLTINLFLILVAIVILVFIIMAAIESF